MTKQEIYDAVRLYLDRPSMDDSDLSALMSSTESELNRELGEHPRNVKRGDYTIPTTDDLGVEYTTDTPLLPLPTDVYSIISVWDENYNYTPYPHNGPTPSVGYIARGDCLNIYPTPPRGTTFYMDYHALLKSLSDLSDVNWVSTYYPDLYIYGMMKEAAVYLKNAENLDLWSREFVRRLSGVQTQGWNQNITPGASIVNG